MRFDLVIPYPRTARFQQTVIWPRMLNPTVLLTTGSATRAAAPAASAAAAAPVRSRRAAPVSRSTGCPFDPYFDGCLVDLETHRLVHNCSRGATFGPAPPPQPRRTVVRTCSLGSECTLNFRQRKLATASAPPQGVNFARLASSTDVSAMIPNSGSLCQGAPIN